MTRQSMPKGVCGAVRADAPRDGATATREYRPGELGAALSSALQTRQHRVGVGGTDLLTRPLRRPSLAATAATAATSVPTALCTSATSAPTSSAVPTAPTAAAAPIAPTAGAALAAVETRVDVTAGSADAPAAASSLFAKLRDVGGRPVVRMAALGVLCVALGAGASRALLSHPQAPAVQAPIDSANAARDASRPAAHPAHDASDARDEATPGSATIDAAGATDPTDAPGAPSHQGAVVEPVTPAMASLELAAGNMRGASEAYARLADRYPGRPVYAVLVRVLEDCDRTRAPQDGRSPCQL